LKRQIRCEAFDEIILESSQRPVRSSGHEGEVLSKIVTGFAGLTGPKSWPRTKRDFNRFPEAAGKELLVTFDPAGESVPPAFTEFAGPKISLAEEEVSAQVAAGTAGARAAG
jgi:hypothetical protein